MGHTPLQFSWELVDTEEAVVRLALALKQTKRPIGIDTETDGLYGALAGVSFSIDGKRGWYIPIRHNLAERNISEQFFIQTFKPLLEDPNILWVFHNAIYDMVIFHNCQALPGTLFNESTMAKPGAMVARFHDTMILGALIDENAPRALKYRSLEEFNLDPDSVNTFDSIVAKGTSIVDVPIDIAGKYAVQDTILTILLYHRFMAHKELIEIMHVFHKLEMPVARIIFEMKVRGIKIDPDTIYDIHARLEQEKLGLEESIYYQASFDPATGQHEAYEEDGQWHNLMEFNLQSSKQKKAVLIDRLGMPVVHKTKTGAPSFDSKKALPKYVGMGYGIAKDMLRHSQVTKILQAYTLALVDKMDFNSRIHPDFKQVGTKTGRFSCANPNFQSMPKGEGIRGGYVAEKGHVLIGNDYDQLELRIACALSQDAAMFDSLMHHPDMHSKNAAFIVGFYEEEIEFLRNSEDILDQFIAQSVVLKYEHKGRKVYGWTDEQFMQMKDSPDELARKIAKQYRNKAKAICFGIQYGMGPREDLKITQDDIDRYLSLYHQLRDYMEEHREFVFFHGYTRTILGRRRRVHQKAFAPHFGTRSSAFRQAFSAHIQGSAADIMKIAMVNMTDEFRQKKIPCWIIAQVHDEVLLECREEYAEEAKEIVERRMEEVADIVDLNVGGVRMPLTAKADIGLSWEAVK